MKLAVDVYRNIIDYLDTQVETGTIAGYSCYYECFSIYFVGGGTLACTFPFSEDIQSTPMRSLDVLNISANSHATGGFQEIITLQPYASELKSKVFDNSAKEVEKSVQEYKFTNNLDNDSVTIEALKNLDRYRVIIIDGHGGWDSKSHSFFGTGEKRTIEKDREYEKDKGIIWLQGGRYGVTYEFFDFHYKNKSLNKPLIYIGACHTMDDDVLSDTLIKCGAKSVAGFNNEVKSLYNRNMCSTFFSELSKSEQGLYNTASKALSEAKSKNGLVDGTTDKWYYFFNEKSKKGEKENTTRAELILRQAGNVDFRLTDNLNDFTSPDAVKTLHEQEEKESNTKSKFVQRSKAEFESYFEKNPIDKQASKDYRYWGHSVDMCNAGIYYRDAWEK